MLEVKVQDSPTIDLGRYSPQFEENINANFTTRTVRYLIALTDAMNGSIDGDVLCQEKNSEKTSLTSAEQTLSVRGVSDGFL